MLPDKAGLTLVKLVVQKGTQQLFTNFAIHALRSRIMTDPFTPHEPR